MLQEQHSTSPEEQGQAIRRTLWQQLLRMARRIASQYSLQAALYYLLYVLSASGKPVSLAGAKKLYEILAGRRVHRATVTKQLNMLRRKGLVRIKDDKIIALKSFRDSLDLFDHKRSLAGRRGARQKLTSIYYVRRIPVPRGLPPGASYYLRRVAAETKKLVKQGDRAAALDLLVHTLLPLRENGVLWLWFKDKFIYYEPKTDQFHIVSSKPVAKLLRKLGYTEGIMTWHILGHERASRIIKQIFMRGPYSWPWARSLAYVMKELGYIRETDPVVIYISYADGRLYVVVRDFYTESVTLFETSIVWRYNELPAPLSSNITRMKRNVVGVVHIAEENDEPYSSRFS